MQEKFYSTKEAADMLKISLRTLRRWKQAGKVTPDIVRGQNEFYYESQLRTLRTLSTEDTEDRFTMAPVNDVTGDTIVPNDKQQRNEKMDKQSRINEATRFFELLYSPVKDSKYGYLWTLPDKITYPFDVSTSENRAAMATKAIELNDKGLNVYFGVCLVDKPLPSDKRTKTNSDRQPTLQPAIWADIDIEGPTHKPSEKEILAPDFNTAKSLLPFKPSIVIDTGGGLHGYNLLVAPVNITNNNLKSVKSRNDGYLDMIRAKCNYKIDGVGDPARVLRVPGTYNYKASRDNAPLCHIVEVNDISYSTDEIDKLIEDSRADQRDTTKNPADKISAAHMKHHISYDNDSDYEAARIERALEILDPSTLSYDDWLNVGKALESVSSSNLSLWDSWSSRDSARYKNGECAYKWQSFKGSGITIATLFKFAQDAGYNEKEFWHEWHNAQRPAQTKNTSAVNDNFISNETFNLIEQQISVSEILAGLHLQSIEKFDIQSVFSFETLVAAAICKDTDIINFETFKKRCEKSNLNLATINSETKKYRNIINKIKSNIRQLKLQQRANKRIESFINDNSDLLSNLNIPVGYRVDDEGIFKIQEGFEVQISHAVIIIANEFYNIDDSIYKTQLACKIRDKWTVPPPFDDDIVYDSRKLISLRKRGIEVSSNNTKEIITYLEELKAVNRDTIKLLKMVNKAGWYKGKTDVFITPYNNSKYIIDDSNNHFIKALKQNGSFEEWKNKALAVYKYPIARFLLCACLAVPLLRVLRVRSFSIYLWGASRAGKTISCKFGASSWGTQDIIRNFRVTQNGVEGEAAESNDFPFILDEKQLADGKLNMTAIAYIIGNGQGKGRMSRDGVMKDRRKWNTIGILNGETPMAEDSATQGAFTRTLYILVNGQVVPTDLAHELYNSVDEHYGWAGQAFIDNLMNEDFEELRRLFQKICKELQEVFPSHLDDHIRYVSLIAVADILINRFFFNIDEETARYAAIENSIDIINMLQTKDDISDVKREWDFILGWIAENNSYFTGNTSPMLDDDKHKPYTNYGEYKGEYLYINIKSLKNALEKEKYSYKKVIHDLVEAGYIVPDDKIEKDRKEPRPTVNTKINGVSTRCIRIEISKINNGDEN